MEAIVARSGGRAASGRR